MSLPDTDRNVLVWLWLTASDLPLIGYYVAGLKAWSVQGNMYQEIYWWCEIPRPPSPTQLPRPT